MRCREVSEEEILRIERFISRISDIYAKGIDAKECAGEGWIGFLTAVKCYHEFEAEYEFGEFAFLCVARRLKDTKRRRNTRIRIESTVPLEDCSEWGSLATRESEEKAEFNAFIESLPIPERTVAKNYIAGYTDDEMIMTSKLSKSELSRARINLKKMLPC